MLHREEARAHAATPMPPPVSEDTRRLVLSYNDQYPSFHMIPRHASRCRNSTAITTLSSGIRTWNREVCVVITYAEVFVFKLGGRDSR